MKPPPFVLAPKQWQAIHEIVRRLNARDITLQDGERQMREIVSEAVAEHYIKVAVQEMSR